MYVENRIRYKQHYVMFKKHKFNNPINSSLGKSRKSKWLLIIIEIALYILLKFDDSWK